MDIPTAVFMYCKFIDTAWRRVEPEEGAPMAFVRDHQFQSVSGSHLSWSRQIKGSNICMRIINRASQLLAPIIDSQNWPVIARRRLPGETINIALGQKYAVKRSRVDLEDRRPTPRAYFQPAIDSDKHEDLINPVDREKNVDRGFFGFEFKARMLAMASLVVDCPVSNAQEVIDTVYEARSHAFLFFES